MYRNYFYYYITSLSCVVIFFTCSEESDDSFSLQSLHVGICLPLISFLMIISYWSWGDLYRYHFSRCCLLTFTPTITIICICNEVKHWGLTSVTFSTKLCFENYAHLKGNVFVGTSEIHRINFKKPPLNWLVRVKGGGSWIVDLESKAMVWDSFSLYTTADTE